MRRLPTPNPLFDTLSTAARRLKLSQSRIRELFDEGVLRGTRDGAGRRLIYPDSVDAEIERRRSARG